MLPISKWGPYIFVWNQFSQKYCSILELRTAYNPTSMQKKKFSIPPFLPSQLGPPRTLRYWWHFSAPPPIPHICCSFLKFHILVFDRQKAKWGKGRKTLGRGVKSQDVEERERIKNWEGNRSNGNYGNKHDKWRGKGRGRKRKKFTTEKHTQKNTMTC